MLKIIVFLLIFVNLVYCKIQLIAPQYIKEGNPFKIQIIAKDNITIRNIKIKWQDSIISPNVNTSIKIINTPPNILLGSDVLDKKTGPTPLILEALLENNKTITLNKSINIQKGIFKTQKLTLPNAMINPPKEALRRIKKERAKIAKALKTYTHQKYYSLPLKRPLQTKITSNYGVKRILNGIPKNPHRGIDFRAKIGAHIKSPANGKVILTGDFYYAGKAVFVDHGQGVISMFFHLSKINVKTGDKVSTKDTIGLGGSSGRSTGPHLHYGLSINGKLVNPMPLFEKP